MTAKNKKVATIEYPLLGIIPDTYPFENMRGVKIYDKPEYTYEEKNDKHYNNTFVPSGKDQWMRVKNTISNEEKRKDYFENYKKSHAKQRNTAKKLNLLNELDRCVLSALNQQLRILYPDDSPQGLAIECSHWKHRGKVFTEYLRSDYFANEVLQYGMMIIIPNGLKEELKCK